MRLIVFFDLPMETTVQRKNYRQFRKFLIKDGYIMTQQSVYTKLVLDGSSAEAAITRLQKNKPPQGIVQVLRITEKQFSGIIEITGPAKDSPIVDTDERLLIL